MPQFDVGTSVEQLGLLGSSSATLTSVAGDALYYDYQRYPSASVNAGSLTAGQSLTLTQPVWIVSAGRTTVQTAFAAELPILVANAVSATAAQFPVAQYASIQAAITAANAAGGGEVILNVGANALSATLHMASKVTLRGPRDEYAVAGQSSVAVAWLAADTSTGPVVEVGATVVGSRIENVLILANGRTGISWDATTNRNGNRARNVEVYGGGSPGVYIGAAETRITNLLVMNSAGDGVQIDALDCQVDTLGSGFNGGNGVVIGVASSSAANVLRAGTWDVYNNTGDGVQINGTAHRLVNIQANNNSQRGVAFLTATGCPIINLFASNNSRAGSGLYPDVDYAHPTASNQGCAIIGGAISNDGTALYGIRSNETVVSYPAVIGVAFSGSYTGNGGGSGVLQYVNSLNKIEIVGCFNMPNVMLPGGAQPGVFLRPNGSADMLQWSDGSGNAWGGVKASGAVYQRRATRNPGAGTLTLDASTGNTLAITLAGNISSTTISGLTAGQEVTIQWIQDATGTRTYAWPTNCKFAAGAAPTASTTANYVDSVTFVYDGTNLIEKSRAIGVH